MYVLCLPPQACALPFSPPTGGHAQGQRGTGPWVVAAEGSGGGGGGCGQLAGDTAAGTGSQGSAAGAQGNAQNWLCPLHPLAGAPLPLSLCWPPAAIGVTWATWRSWLWMFANSPLLCPVLFTQSFLGKAAMVWAQRGQCGPRSCLWGYWFSAGY